MKPVISVIVPIYNMEPYLEECVRSIQNQTLREIEIILVDDGSPDKCPQMCDRYAGEDQRIRVIHQKNAGASAARNAGLRMAKGKYIAFVDSDDWVHPDYLSLMLEHMVPGGMAACDRVDEWDPAAKSAHSTDHLGEYETTVLDRTQAQASILCHNRGNSINNGPYCKLYDQNLIRTNRVAFCEDLTHFEDELFVMQYLSYLTAKVVWIKAVAYHYRYHPSSARSQWIQVYQEFSPQIFSEIIMLEREFQYLEHAPEMQRYYKARLLAARKDPLAIMEINGWRNIPEYKIYLRELRAGLSTYLRCDGWSCIDKICTVLCAIHPKLFYLCRTAGLFVLDHIPGLGRWLQRGM